MYECKQVALTAVDDTDTGESILYFSNILIIPQIGAAVKVPLVQNRG